MVRRGYGRIVNVASLAGKDGTPRSAAYAASKGAVIALTKAIGKEVAGPACWSTRSPRGSSGRRSSTAFQRETLDFIVGQIPLGRTGQPHEFAALVAFLVSEDLSFAAGACFDISGAWRSTDPRAIPRHGRARCNGACLTRVLIDKRLRAGPETNWSP